MQLVCMQQYVFFLLDFPSSISASLHNSTVIEMYDSEIQYVFVLSVCSDTILPASYSYSYVMSMTIKVPNIIIIIVECMNLVICIHNNIMCRCPYTSVL